MPHEALMKSLRQRIALQDYAIFRMVPVRRKEGENFDGLKTADTGLRCAAAPVGQILDARGNTARSIDLHAAHE